MDLIEFPEGGFVRLDAVMADDLSVVNSARVSFGKRVSEMSNADKALIGYLLRNQHGTPFEHNCFRFHIKAPIFVAREWFRHRIGWSYNELSARYTEMEFDMFVPHHTDIRTQVGKPGSYSFEKIEGPVSVKASDMISGSMNNSFVVYEELLSLGVAKELARTVLPVGIFTQFYATCNARSLMNFIHLRADKNAQKEIRDYANALEAFLKQAMPETYSAFIANDRKAP